MSEEGLTAELRGAERDVQAGHFIPHEAVKAWLLSWGSDQELSPPRCVCGKGHSGPALWRERLVANRTAPNATES